MSHTILHKLQFSNLFSYGANNQLDLSKNRITQLTAVNGSGKSSLALIIQELLYNKNIKGIKKGDLLNRWSKDKNWEASIAFTTNNKHYVVHATRSGASSKIKLLEDGIDVSEHKVLDTYKKIQDIIGLDFEIFSQLTYQSSTDLLDFLKATDTNRKKFLINLFNLVRYLEIGDSLKLIIGEKERDLTEKKGELKSVEDFLHSVVIPEYMSEVLVPNIDVDASVRAAEIQKELANLTETCKKIDKNNMLISEQATIQFDITLRAPATPLCLDDYQAILKEIIVLENEIKTANKELSSLKIADRCNACGQPIDNSQLIKLKNDLQYKIKTKTELLNMSKNQAAIWSAEINAFEEATKYYNKNKQKIDRFEQISQLIDKTLPIDYPNYNSLTNELKALNSYIAAQTVSQTEAINHNKRVSAHNAKVEALKEQKSEFLIRQSTLQQDIVGRSSQLTNLTILKKAFSTSGIVAFKLENLTKELESTINMYLSTLSDGQFQIEFSLDKEKLNINVINNGISAPIETMSGGEFSRIQTSILLAIRNLLSKIGGSSINLLFLDEITGVLDDEGKEKLVEVLQREKDLNVFLISHDFTHPLIDKISINKINNISSIQS